MTNTKRLRELHSRYFNGPPGARVTVAEGAELRSLILAACDELEAKRARMFPIMSGRAVPFDWIAPYESQAQHNHGQSLERLAERGGLSTVEALCVVHCLSWRERSVHWKDDCVANVAWESWCDSQLKKRSHPDAVIDEAMGDE